MHWHHVRNAALRAQAAYIIDAEESRLAFEGLGNDWMGIFKNDSHQAVLSMDRDNKLYLSISGTRFLYSIGDIWDDIHSRKILTKGNYVSIGAYDGLIDVWEWAKSIAGEDREWNVDGHSLGAIRALYTPIFIPQENIGDIFVFGPIKGTTKEFWEKYKETLDKIFMVVNNNDLFHSWPFFSDFSHPPTYALWLRSHNYEFIDPNDIGWRFNLFDHSMEKYIRNINKFSGKKQYG